MSARIVDIDAVLSARQREQERDAGPAMAAALRHIYDTALLPLVHRGYCGCCDAMTLNVDLRETLDAHRKRCLFARAAAALEAAGVL